MIGSGAPGDSLFESPDLPSCEWECPDCGEGCAGIAGHSAVDLHVRCGAPAVQLGEIPTRPILEEHRSDTMPGE